MAEKNILNTLPNVDMMNLLPLTQHAVNTIIRSLLSIIETWWVSLTSLSMRQTTFFELHKMTTWKWLRKTVSKKVAQKSWNKLSHTTMISQRKSERTTVGNFLGWVSSTGIRWTICNQWSSLPSSELILRTPWASSTTSSRAASLEKWTTQKHGILNGIKVGHESLRNKWRILSKGRWVKAQNK